MTPPVESHASWHVQTVGDEHFARLPAGEPALITLAGQAAEIPPGWRPLFIYAGFAPIYLLELRHEDGRESTWFLDHRFDRCGYDNPDSLPKWDGAILRYRAARVLVRMWDQVLGSGRQVLDADVTGFLALGAAVRGRIARLCEPAFDIRTIAIDLEGAQPRGATLFHTWSNIRLLIERLLAVLRTDLLARSFEAARTGRLDWESPIDGRMLTTTGGIWLTDFLFAYRVVVTEFDLAFYVLVSGHPCHVIGILFPTERIVFTIGARYDSYVVNFHKVPVEVLLFRHLCHYGDRMMEAWRGGLSGVSALFRERLISGQLWHDLTGLDLLVRNVPAESLPEVIGLWGGVPEIYGDTEDIFPETQGRISRVPSEHAMIGHAYDERRLVVRTQGSYVSRKLYTKLIEVSTRDPAIERSRTLAAEIERLKCPLVMLGLRVENRTVEDLPEFCAQVIDHLVRRCGRVAIVIDGHNSARGDTPNLSFNSEFQQHAKEEPIVAERRVVQALSDRYKGGPVILINNIGGSMAQSIFWCNSAHFFITMYGTGLAKYRWACNQTGLIVTSRWTLHHQGHLHIYEEEYLEDPSPLMFLPEEFIEDLPDSPQLIAEPGNPPARWNFRVRLEGLHGAIDELLRRNFFPAP